MKKVKWFIPFMAMAAILIVISCGDDENPASPGDDPTASTLSATSGTTNTVFASWSMCPDNDFSEYNLYRSTSSGISGNPPSSPIRTASNASDTTFSDPGLDWGQTYYYALQTKNTDNNTAWSNEVQVVIADSGSSSDYLTCYQVQGQQAESPFDGQTVSVTGIVVVAGDEYYSSSAAYAVIMDEGGGEWHGLTLYGTDVSSLARGDSITITGTIDEFDNFGGWVDTFTELVYPTEIVIHSTGHTLPSPEPLDTGDAGQEQWESVLVSVTNVTVTEDDLGYGEWAVSDGSGDIRIDDLGDYTYTPSIGDTFSEIIGVCWYSFDNFKIEPRNDSDLIN